MHVSSTNTVHNLNAISHAPSTSLQRTRIDLFHVTTNQTGTKTYIYIIYAGVQKLKLNLIRLRVCVCILVDMRAHKIKTFSAVLQSNGRTGSRSHCESFRQHCDARRHMQTVCVARCVCARTVARCPQCAHYVGRVCVCM